MLWTSDFRGKTVVVTGASSGIGRETALAFGAVGSRVALLARRRAALESVARDISRHGGEALVLPTDVTASRAVRAAFRAAHAAFGRLDVVVNNAGVLIPAPVTELRAADLRTMLRTASRRSAATARRSSRSSASPRRCAWRSTARRYTSRW